MPGILRIRQAGPGVTVQDHGRPGYLAQGLSQGGAADLFALAEGAALLGQQPGLAALEMAGFGGVFEVTEPCRVALTGAPMRAMRDGEALAWNTSHVLLPGQQLGIGAAGRGVYGYLSVGGGIGTEPLMGSRAVHLTGGVGAPLREGDQLPIGTDPQPDVIGMTLDIEDRFSGGTLRVVPSAQTFRFSDDMRARFEETAFTRDTRGNRQGVRMVFDGAPFATDDQLTILSEVIVPGDIQVTGDGTPFVLLPESQTTGGYPRIGTVIPDDLPKVAQAAPGTPIRFTFISLDEAVAIGRRTKAALAALPGQVRPLVRAPHDISDLLSYQLISGVTAGTDHD